MSDRKPKRSRASEGEERQTSEAFDYPPDVSAGNLVRTAHRAFQKTLEIKITPRGVTRGQWYFLRELWVEDGVPQRELSARTGMTEPTTVVALKSMEKARLVRRTRDKIDRRIVRVHLTEKGRRARGELLPLAKQVNEIATKGVSAKDMDAFRRALRRMIDNLNNNEK